MNWSEFERNLSAYIDDELTAEARLAMETFIDENEDARAEFESHLAAWEAAQSAQSGAAPEGLWEGIEAALQTETGETSLDDLALMIRGLAGEVQDLRREVRDLRGEMQGGGEWTDERDAASGDIRVRSSVVPDTPRRGNVENVPRRGNFEQFRRSS